MADRSPIASTCPRCGSPVTQATGGVCLVCLGEHALRAAGAAGAGAPDSFATSSMPTPTPGGTAARFDESAPPRTLGSYEIIEEIGRGGMGRVYAARHMQLGTIVALKVIGVGRFATAEEEMRFVREAQTAARLRHPHIVTVHDAGHAEGVAYFTMDLVPDGDLATRIRERPPAPREAAVLFRKITLALAHAHREGVLHRDLKPSNILLEGDEPRVADFGLATETGPGGALTAATRMLGTPPYLAPEIFSGGTRACSPASDVYALGAVLYELLTGRPPRTGHEVAAADFEPVAPRLLAPGTPRDLETICLKCLERAPAARYHDAAALAEDVDRFLEGRPILARPVSPLGRFARWSRRRPALATVWLLVVTLAAGSTAAAVFIDRARARAVSERERAVAAEGRARDEFRTASLARAEALRLTRRAGRRAEALAAIADAARVRPGRDARDAALAAFALHDMELVRRWPIDAPAPLDTIFAADGSSYAVAVPGGFAWRETGTDREFGRMAAPEGAEAIGWQTLSRDGRRFAARFTDEIVRVWARDEAGVRLLRELPDRPHPWPRPRHVYGRDLAFSPDGARLALAHREGGFSLVDLADGREPGRFVDTHPSTRVEFSPDGSMLAAACSLRAAGQKLHLVDTATLAPRHTVDLGGNLFDLAWTAGGTHLGATTDAPALRVFRAADGAALSNLPAPEGNIARLAFAGGDQMLLTGAAEQVFRWRWRRSGEELLRIEGVETARIWPATDGREILTSDHTSHGLHYRVVAPTGLRTQPVDRDGYSLSFGALGSLAWSRDGRWLAAAAVGMVAVFRADTLERAALAPTVLEGDDPVTVAFLPGGDALLTCGLGSGLQRRALARDGTIAPLEEASVLLAEPGWAIRAVSADGRRLALADQAGGRVKVFALEGDTISELSAWSVPGAYGLAFGPRAETLLINVDHTAPGAAGTALRVWDVADGRERLALDAPISAEADWDPASGLAFTSNGEKLSLLWTVDGSDRWIRGPALDPAVPQGNTTTLALAPGGTLAAVAAGGAVYLIDPGTGALLATLRDEVPASYTSDFVFSPDGHTLALLDVEGTLRTWHLPTLRAELVKLGLDW